MLPTRPRTRTPQALGRIPETLVCAMEFIQMPTPPVRSCAGLP